MCCYKIMTGSSRCCMLLYYASKCNSFQALGMVEKEYIIDDALHLKNMPSSKISLLKGS